MENDNSKKKKLDYVSIAMVLFIVVLVISVLYYDLSNQNKTLKLELIKNVTKISKCLEENTRLEDELKTTTKELEKSKKRIMDIKDSDYLLKRDIEFYIRNTYLKIPKSVTKNIAEIIVNESKKENLSAELIVGIMEVESHFNPMAVGPKTKYGHARGLMQVMPEWAEKFDLESKYDLHDIDVNIKCGIKVFKIHLEEGEGKISQGLYLYVNKDRSYVDKVYNAMGKFVSFRATVDEEKSEHSETNENGEGDEENAIDTTTEERS